MSLLITGYPYIRENYFKTLRFYPEKGKLFFLLPKKWKVKRGRVVYYPPKDNNVFTANAFFYHSNYLLIGGLLKGWMPGFLPFLLKNKEKKDIKVVFTLTEPVLLTTLYNAIVSKLFGLKHFIFTWENIAYREKFKGLNLFFKELMIKLNIFFSDGIVCGNKKAVEILKQYTNKPTPNIPFAGVDTEFFTPEKRGKVFRGRDLRNKIIFSFVGALEHRKAVHLIIEAFKTVVRELPEAYLIIIGTGEPQYENKLDDLIKTNSLENSVIKVSWISHEELKDVFSITDIFLYPSMSHGGWEEQLGYLLVEASAAGLAIISTLSGSIDEVIVNNKTGLLIKPNNVNELKDVMIALGRDPDKQKKLGEEARKFTKGNFSYAVIANKFYDFFKSYDK